MRGLILLVVVVLFLFLAGWLSFSNSGDRATINLEKQEIREDTANIVQEGNELADEAREAIQPDEPSDEAPGPATK